MTEQYDLITIGGGSGGVAASRRAAEYGARVAIIEKGRMGGTCVNVGCVPKKIMWYAESLAHEIHEAPEYGFDVSVGGQDWGELKRRRDAYIKRLNDIYENNLTANKVRIIQGEARFENSNTVRVGELSLTAPHIVIATGGEPRVPDLDGAGLGITSDGFFELAERPARVAIVGAGYVGVELAAVLAALGSKVSICARYDSLLRSFDEMLQRAVVGAFESDGVELNCHATVERVERVKDGLTLYTEDQRSIGPVDCVIWAVGRRPLTESLGLENTDVSMNEDGFIPVDDYQATNVDGVYAIGDVTGKLALTPVAIAAGRRLSDRIFGGMSDRHLDYTNVPTVIFTHPPVGTIGLTEMKARELYGDQVRAYISKFVPLSYAVSDHKPESQIKLLTKGEEETVIGIHLFGPASDEMLQGFAVAVRMGATKKDFDDTVAIHPTSAEELVLMR
ncbi:MAG: glutathione-disulfide reductase [Gammaproteobacteria bacterium]